MYNVLNVTDPEVFAFVGSQVAADILYTVKSTTADNIRYLRDLGKSPKVNAPIYSGEGTLPNGTDQTLTIAINETIGSFVKRVDGVLTITDDFGAIANLVIDSNNTHQDYALFTRNLTATEKALAESNPEDFMLMAKDDADCVFASTMAMDDDGWMADQSKGLGSDVMIDGDFINGVTDCNGIYGATVAHVGETLEITSTTTFDTYARFEKTVIPDTYYLVSLYINSKDATELTTYIGSEVGSYKIDILSISNLDVRKQTYIVKSSTDMLNLQINRPSGVTGDKIILEYLHISPITAYQMSNFTTTAQATQLQTGSQSFLLDFDVSGKIIQSKSASINFQNNAEGYLLIPTTIPTQFNPNVAVSNIEVNDDVITYEEA